ncbi:MAG: hypothetical protein K0V04_12325, partial [Deltaproteobacteria bacterium]|nr:hypothetical protein [Deltaproteobacteria bacterium]
MTCEDHCDEDEGSRGTAEQPASLAAAAVQWTTTGDARDEERQRCRDDEAETDHTTRGLLAMRAFSTSESSAEQSKHDDDPHKQAE